MNLVFFLNFLRRLDQFTVELNPINFTSIAAIPIKFWISFPSFSFIGLWLLYRPVIYLFLFQFQVNLKFWFFFFKAISSRWFCFDHVLAVSSISWECRRRHFIFYCQNTISKRHPSQQWFNSNRFWAANFKWRLKGNESFTLPPCSINIFNRQAPLNIKYIQYPIT